MENIHTALSLVPGSEKAFKKINYVNRINNDSIFYVPLCGRLVTIAAGIVSENTNRSLSFGIFLFSENRGAKP